MIDPRGLTVFDWTDSMAMVLTQVAPMKIRHENEWQSWALNIAQAYPNSPNPLEYGHWRDWAMRLNENLRLI